MAFDIQAIVKDIVAKLSGNSNLMDAFRKDPINTITKTLGINIPDSQIKEVVRLVTEKLGPAKAGSFLEKIKSFFMK